MDFHTVEFMAALFRHTMHAPRASEQPTVSDARGARGRRVDGALALRPVRARGATVEPMRTARTPRVAER